MGSIIPSSVRKTPPAQRGETGGSLLDLVIVGALKSQSVGKIYPKLPTQAAIASCPRQRLAPLLALDPGRQLRPQHAPPAALGARSNAQVLPRPLSVITITGFSDHDGPDQMIIFTGMRTLIPLARDRGPALIVLQRETSRSSRALSRRLKREWQASASRSATDEGTQSCQIP